VSLAIKDGAGLRQIGVLGDLAEPGDRAALVAALAGSGQAALELTLYDARTLPGEVLEALLDRAAGASALKIRAYHHYLLHHLLRLGLPVLGVGHGGGLAQAAEFKAVAIGGSADSLDKILAIVEALPPGQAAVFVVQHVLEDEPNLLDKLLRARTDYVVEMPQHMTAVEPGTIYVAPPGHHMKVAHGRIYLTRDRKINYARPAIDVLFRAVAEEYREHALAVLLCGYGHDGAAGLATIRRLGGCALVENGGECGAHDMPDAAAAAQACDHVLLLPELRCFVAAAVAGRTRQVAGPLVDLLLEAAFARYGYDYRGYQRDTVERRLDNLYATLGVADFFALQREILTDPEAFERLFLELSINVTAFFRHPEQFRILRERVLPYLDSFPHIKIWSAGCANGKEAYSLAILLDELGMLDKAQIFATDINPYQLEEGKSGIYALERLEEGFANYAASGGQGRLEDWLSVGARHIKVDPRLRKHVLFYPHSLVHDGPFNEFQLILCRNVLIYFHPSQQKRVADLFARSLHRDGFLMLGPSEGAVLGDGQGGYASYAADERVYRRQGEGAAP
jgi:chemotaxis protein methyltransferase CheR